jgi:predicted Rossmann-fold nucleotide-binding protein
VAAGQAGGIRGAMRAVWRGVRTAATAVTGWLGGGKRGRGDDDDEDDAARPKAKAKIGDG